MVADISKGERHKVMASIFVLKYYFIGLIIVHGKPCKDIFINSLNCRDGIRNRFGKLRMIISCSLSLNCTELLKEKILYIHSLIILHNAVKEGIIN